MAGERQTEPHQAGVGPSPREALEALERADLRDRAEAAEAELARVRAERDEAREQRDYWRRIAETVAPDHPVVAIPTDTLEAISARAEAAEARAEDFQRRWNEGQDFIRDKQWDEPRTDTDVVAEIVALIRSYADVHMTKALADLIEHKYVGRPPQS